MKDNITPLIIGIFILILLFIVFIGYNFDQNKDLWNNGYCSCGGHWEYEAAVEHENSTTTYIYHCDKCENSIEIEEFHALLNDIKKGA